MKVNLRGENFGQKVVYHMSKKFSYLGALVACAPSPFPLEKSIIVYFDSSSSAIGGYPPPPGILLY